MNENSHVPVKVYRVAGNTNWPFSTMRIGESFLASWEPKYGKDPHPLVRSRWQVNVVSAARYYQPMKFKTKMAHDEGGVRIWRIE